MKFKKLTFGIIVIAILTTGLWAQGHDSLLKPYDNFLNTYVGVDGMVDYKALSKAGGADAPVVKKISAIFLKLDTGDWSEKEKIAMWINAYNFFAIKMVLLHYPISELDKGKANFVWSMVFPKNSVQQIKNVWDLSFFDIGGKMYSLNDIEHKKLRADFKEPRIHAAIVCASMSCPKLRNAYYAASGLNLQLDKAMKDFLSDESRNRINEDSKTIELSQIFNWFSEDFVEKDVSEKKGLKAYISQYIGLSDTDLAAYSLDFLKYDWSLNGQ